MATRDQMQRSIEPGSISYGNRQQVEGMLPAAQGTGPAPGQTPVPGLGGDPLALPGSPEDMLLGGDFPSDPNIPATDGMSVGPGSGPPLEEGDQPSSYAQRLRVIATNAKTPQLRAQARLALKLLARRGVT